MIRIILSFLLTFFTISSAYSFDYNRKLILKKDFKELVLLGDVDYRNDEGGLFYRHYDVGVGKDFKKSGWSIAAKYRNVYEKRGGEWDLVEQRPQLQVSKAFDHDWVRFSARIRQEYHILDGDDISRSRLRLMLQSKKGLFGIKPFVSNEFFYILNTSRYNRNRSDVGLALPKIYQATPSVIYRHNQIYDNVSKRWGDESLLLFKLVVQW